MAIFNMIHGQFMRTSKYLALPHPYKTLLCASVFVLSVEGGMVLKEWLGNWRQNRRDPEAYLERKVSYLARELKRCEDYIWKRVQDDLMGREEKGRNGG